MSDITYESAAKECASYIFDSESEQIGYEENIQSGGDPRDHILYHAALVLGREKDFEIDINEYINENKDNTSRV